MRTLITRALSSPTCLVGANTDRGVEEPNSDILGPALEERRPGKNFETSLPTAWREGSLETRELPSHATSSEFHRPPQRQANAAPCYPMVYLLSVSRVFRGQSGADSSVLSIL